MLPLSFRHVAALVVGLSLPLGCGSERPPPCATATCGATVDVTALPTDAAEVGVDQPAPADLPTDVSAATDVPAGQDVVRIDSGVDAGLDAGVDAARRDAADVIEFDVPMDPPVTQTRDDLGTRGLVASLPCGNVLAHLDVTVTRRTVPPNSFDVTVRNASPTEVISVWYNATLQMDWNLESLVSDLGPGMTATMSPWRLTGSPAWYVLGIARNQHYYVNDSGIFVELPCGRAARNTTQAFRRTITP
ncbi:MAG: hypothetical protein U0325_29380 [Polyangiales bacterium]